MQNSVRSILSAFLLVLIAQIASAEVVRLKSGDTIRGTIIFQNEQVLVIKKADGSRFQYQQSDVEAVLEDEAEEAPKQEETTPAKKKKLTVSLQLAGGMTILPGNTVGGESQTGGNVQADLFIGTCTLLTPHSSLAPVGERVPKAGKGLFLGAGLGYHLHYVGATAYSFLPIQLRAEAPLSRGKHAPMLGLSAGYGISLQKSAKGGACADITFGWRCQLSDERAISLGLFSNIQQTKLTDHTDIIDGNAFVAPSAGRAFFDFGIRFAAYL